MNVRPMVMACLVTGALSAQSADSESNVRVVLFAESIQTEGILLGQGIKDQADRQAGPGLRILGRVGEEDSRWYWELSARFPSRAHMVTNRDISSAPPANILDATAVRVTYSYWSAGAGYLLPLGPWVDLGLHVEGRAETINPQGDCSTTAGGVVSVDSHTVYWRPWGRLSLDVKIPTGPVKTILGFDAGVAAFKTSQREIQIPSQIDSQTLRSMAPKWSAALYAGVQF